MNPTHHIPSANQAIDYQKIFESAPALFLLLRADETFPILDASNGYLRATYTAREDIVGRSLFEVFPDNPGDQGATGVANLRASLERVVASGRPDTMAVQRYDVRRAVGEGEEFEERHWSCVNAPVIGPDGRLLFIIHRVEDVTDITQTNRALTSEGETLRLEVLARGRELQEANRQLREVTEQFQAMYDQGLFAARLRLDGTVADINRSAVEVCGFNRADILDQPFWECGWWNRSPEVQAWVRNAVEQAVAGELFRGESRYFWGDGSVHIVDFACMPIRDASGRVVVAIATGMDITERVQGEQNQRALEAERQRSEALAEIDRAKTMFFSNVSHEFRTPLTLMLGPIEQILANSATPAAIRTQLELAHRNALRLLKLVNSLLDFSRIEAGRADVSYEATPLDALTRDLASTFRSAMERAGLAFTVDCEDLGEPVYVDREMWEKIVLNLLSNAFKFTLHGSVVVRLRREMDNAVLEITDTGVGVAQHELPRLFERFHRVEGTAGRTQEGSGIGLALVQELVKLHGGGISAVSELGRGTTLRVSVPLGKSHLPPERIKSPRLLAPTTTGSQAFVQEALRWIPANASEGSSMSQSLGGETLPNHRYAKVAGARILLADDNADMRTYVRDLLSADYIVEAVANGEQALDAVRRDRPDLVVTDIMMPRLDGLGFLKILRIDESLREIPVMLLSARAGEEAQVEGLDAGADDYMVKPFSARELLARIGARLELVRMRRENEERFHAFVSATSEVIYRMSPDWREMRSLRGRDFIADTDDPNHSWLDKYIYPDDQPHVMAKIREAIHTKSVFQLEHRIRRVDGTVGWTHSRAVPLIDASGNITEWFGAASDVTERKATEQALRERDEALSNADRRKDEFLATLAHELRNPLAPIRNSLHLLRLAGSDHSTTTLVHDMMERQVGQMVRLVDDLMEISRITRGKIELRKERVDLADVVQSAVETSKPLIEAACHQLKISFCSEPLILDADPVRVAQILANLLNNAAKYTEDGGQIQLTTRAEGAYALVSIRDNGMGIPAAMLSNVFDLFTQVDGTYNRAQGGLGIGLTLVRTLVKLHGGTVEAFSDGVGRGSEFVVRLPLAVRPNHALSFPEPNDRQRSVASRRILIVDDNRDSAQSLGMLLKFLGAEVSTANDGSTALDTIQRYRPSVVLLDIGMPGMDGYEVAKRARQEPENAAVTLIALTGWGQEEDRRRSREAGFDHHLVKPVDLSALQAILASLDRSPD